MQYLANDAKGRRVRGQHKSTCMVRGATGQKFKPAPDGEKSKRASAQPPPPPLAIPPPHEGDRHLAQKA